MISFISFWIQHTEKEDWFATERRREFRSSFLHRPRHDRHHLLTGKGHHLSGSYAKNLTEWPLVRWCDAFWRIDHLSFNILCVFFYQKGGQMGWSCSSRMFGSFVLVWIRGWSNLLGSDRLEFGSSNWSAAADTPEMMVKQTRLLRSVLQAEWAWREEVCGIRRCEQECEAGARNMGLIPWLVSQMHFGRWGAFLAVWLATRACWHPAVSSLGRAGRWRESKKKESSHLENAGAAKLWKVNTFGTCRWRDTLKIFTWWSNTFQ